MFSEFAITKNNVYWKYLISWWPTFGSLFTWHMVNLYLDFKGCSLHPMRTIYIGFITPNVLTLLMFDASISGTCMGLGSPHYSKNMFQKLFSMHPTIYIVKIFNFWCKIIIIIYYLLFDNYWLFLRCSLHFFKFDIIHAFAWWFIQLITLSS